MRIMKFISPLVFMAMICISIYSCGSENPVTPVDTLYHFDSARFRWELHRFDGVGYFTGIWMRDTNDIYIGSSSGYYTHFFNGEFSVSADPTFYLQFVGGFDKNNGYAIGFDGRLDSSLCIIKKWNGSSFENIKIENNYYMQPRRGYFYKPDYIWLWDYNKSQCYRFDGLSLRKYQIAFPNDTNCSIDKIYYDSTLGKLRMTVIVNTNPLPSDQSFNYKVYDLDGSNWNENGEFSLSFQYPAENYYPAQYINGYILNRSGDHINIYNGAGFVPFLKLPGITFKSNLGGFSRSNILAIGLNNNIPLSERFEMFLWNGIKWSKEELRLTFDQNVVYPVSESLYIIINNNFNLKESYLIIGHKNN